MPSRQLGKVAALLPFIATFAAPSTSAAQWTNPYTGNTFNNPMSSLADTMITQRMQQRLLERSIVERGGRAGRTSARAPIQATDFKPDKQRLFVDAVVRNSGGTPEQQRMLRALIDGTIAAFEKTGRRNNLAHAFAFVLAVSLQIDGRREMGAEESTRLALDMNDALASTPDLARMTPRQKQDMYEACLTTAAILVANYGAGEQGDENARKAAREMARGVVEKFFGRPR